MVGIRVCERWAAGLSLLLVVACTRDNPAFGDDGPAGSAETGTTSGIETAGNDAPDPPDGTSSPDTTGKAGTDDTTSGTSGGETGSTTEGPEDTGPTTCDQHPDGSFDISVEDVFGNPILPQSCDAVLTLANGNMVQVDGVLHHVVCDGCKCNPQTGLTIGFDPPLEIPPLNECVAVAVWAGPNGAGSCAWRGIAVLPSSNDPIPLWFATNSRQLPQSVFGPVEVGLEEDAVCNDIGACLPAPGTYALSFFDDVPAYVGVPTLVEIGFVASVPYTVNNRMATVDLECTERVAFTATQRG